MGVVGLLGAISVLLALVTRFLDRQSRLARTIVLTFASLAALRYFFWRVTQTLPPFEVSLRAFVMYGFLGLELMVAHSVFKDLYLLRRSVNRSRDADAQLGWYEGNPPRVDILIPTYNEAWDVLEKTLVSACCQDYANYRVWVLDDGRRAWLREKAEALGIGYITRDHNTHYKSGNLNEGIAALRAKGLNLQFLAVFDADFIARPEFLLRTMSLMKSETVGIVQTPQFFYNQDPYQRLFGGVNAWPDEQRPFYDVYLPSLDALGWASCCGTSFLIRVSALERIGGFATESLSEDTLTSRKLSEIGFRTVYLNERLSVGLAPDGLAEFVSQRARILHGGIQIARYFTVANGLWSKLRHQYALWNNARFGLMRPAWIAGTALFWVSGTWVMQVGDPWVALSYFGPLWIDRLLRSWMFAGRQAPFVSDAHWLLLAPMWFKETLVSALGARPAFAVTDKGKRHVRATLNWRLVWVHWVLALALVAGAAYALLEPHAAARSASMLPLHVLMTGYFLLLILAAIAPALELPQRRRSERYPTNEQAIAWMNGKAVPCRCKDLSIDGTLLSLSDTENIPATIQLELAGVGSIPARLARPPVKGCAAFFFESEQARAALIRKVYCGDGYVPAPERWSVPRAVCSFLWHLPRAIGACLTTRTNNGDSAAGVRGTHERALEITRRDSNWEAPNERLSD